ncbi:MAG: glycerophosphodiester phosphodiesterase family protein [Microbacterium sp.]|uniref:glycerophosphodiester phosphodiesterase family protein n=1 Tax=Microbacterium sp. TaxID=51671 RepID=UPI0039E5F030
MIAHRGLTLPDDTHAENTLASVASALSAGAVYVESDCRVTRDGVVVLFHDDTVERVTGDPRPVADLTLRELDALMEDRGGLLTLATALDGFPEARWNLDVKAAAAAEGVGRLVAPHAERVLVASFSDERRLAALAASADAGAEIRPATSAGRGAITRMLAATSVGSARLARRALDGIDALQVPERSGRIRVLSDRLIRLAHDAGAEVHVWTVNDIERMRELVARGVDGIVTDRADLALDALG